MIQLGERKVRKHEVKNLKPIHVEICRRLVRGEKPKQVSDELGISRQQISNLVNSAAAKPTLERMNQERDEAFVRTFQHELLNTAVASG